MREDRRQLIAIENRKLMENMTKILSEGRKQEPHIKAPSKNERIRKELVDKINRDNKAMVSRLEAMPAIISSSKLEDDFNKHLSISKNLRRRRRLFQALTATKQETEQRAAQTEVLAITTEASPYKSMAEFRANVISKKKMEARPELSPARGGAGNLLSQFENLPGMSPSQSVRFEMTHDPSKR